jgi:hypothetical protein
MLNSVRNAARHGALTGIGGRKCSCCGDTVKNKTIRARERRTWKKEAGV